MYFHDFMHVVGILFCKGRVRRTHVYVVSTHFNFQHTSSSPILPIPMNIATRYMSFSFLCFFCQDHVGKVVKIEANGTQVSGIRVSSQNRLTSLSFKRWYVTKYFLNSNKILIIS